MVVSVEGSTRLGRIGVTGSSGLLGQAVVADLLASGYEVVGADRTAARTRAGGFCSVEWDGRDVAALVEALADCSGLVHLAAIPAPYSHPDELVFTNNTAATFAALQAAASSGITRVAMASSISAYGMAFGPEQMGALYVPVDEDHPMRTFDPYALSKEVDETTARTFCRRYGMSVAALRFHWVADREQQQAARSLRGEVDNGSEIRNLWGYVDVRDAARACRLALEAARDRPYGFVALNIAAGDVLARLPIADLLAAHAPEVEIRGELAPTQGAWSIARAAEVIGWRPEHSWRDPE
jgi:nucleoside-diphosphate-sugar epimerase